MGVWAISLVETFPRTSNRRSARRRSPPRARDGTKTDRVPVGPGTPRHAGSSPRAGWFLGSSPAVGTGCTSTGEGSPGITPRAGRAGPRWGWAAVTGTREGWGWAVVTRLVPPIARSRGWAVRTRPVPTIARRWGWASVGWGCAVRTRPAVPIARRGWALDTRPVVAPIAPALGRATRRLPQVNFADTATPRDTRFKEEVNPPNYLRKHALADPKEGTNKHTCHKTNNPRGPAIGCAKTGAGTCSRARRGVSGAARRNRLMRGRSGDIASVGCPH
mmetsp:Transcript_10198/g.37761  ORF Transcript_10198/g.37761 Transcript_10198/m.37761 type:complete len:275 (+) Transcript_10198:2414-3238(+)